MFTLLVGENLFNYAHQNMTDVFHHCCFNF